MGTAMGTAIAIACSLALLRGSKFCRIHHAHMARRQFGLAQAQQRAGIDGQQGLIAPVPVLRCGAAVIALKLQHFEHVVGIEQNRESPDPDPTAFDPPPPSNLHN